MRYILSLLFASILVATGYFGYTQLMTTPCQKTLYYDIGTVSPEFNISKESFAAIASGSELPWENEIKHNVFQYKAGSPFTINLIFDERQADSNARKALDASIESDKNNLNNLRSRYDQLISGYERDLNIYNKIVASWNEKGGAPQEEYTNLNNQKSDLQKRFQTIKNLENQINQLNTTVNGKIDQYNSGAGTMFHKGEFNGKDITIYEFQGEKELKLTLVHELGHALGLGHTNDKASIMYPVLEDQNSNLSALGTADVQAVTALCEKR